MNHDAKNASEEGKPVTPVNSCRGEWSTPKNCDVTKGQCEYHIQWSYSTRTDYIAFTISTTHTDLWTGVGFSDDHKMVIWKKIKNLWSNVEEKGGIAWMENYHFPAHNLIREKNVCGAIFWRNLKSDQNF